MILLSFFGLFIGFRFLCQAFISVYWIFQVSREQEQFRRKYFFHKFSSYSLFSPISNWSLTLLLFGVICGLGARVIKFVFHVFIFLSVCAVDFLYVISHFFGCVLEEFDFFSLHFSMGCYFPFLVSSSDLGFFSNH